MGLGYVEEKGGEVMGGDFLALPFFLSFFLSTRLPPAHLNVWE